MSTTSSPTRSPRCWDACGGEAFELRVEDLKSFGGRKPRAIVATLGPAQALMELQAEHERLMQRVGLEPEGRKFTPHVTLARLREFVEPAGRRLSGGARAVPLAAVQGLALRAVLVARVGRRRALCGRGRLSAGGVTSTRMTAAGCVTELADRCAVVRLQHRLEQPRLHVEHGGGEAVAVGENLAHQRERGRARRRDLAHHARRNRSSARRRICARAAACACCRRGTPCAGT